MFVRFNVALLVFVDEEYLRVLYVRLLVCCRFAVPGVVVGVLRRRVGRLLLIIRRLLIRILLLFLFLLVLVVRLFR